VDFGISYTLNVTGYLATVYQRQQLHKTIHQKVTKQFSSEISPLNTKSRQLYLKTQLVPRSKHFSSRL
jgi:hypothetical protein